MPSPLEPVPGAAQPKPNVRKTLDTTHERLLQLFHNVLSLYATRQFGLIGGALPFRQRSMDFLDLLSAADIVAGSVGQYFTGRDEVGEQNVRVKEGAEKVLLWLGQCYATPAALSWRTTGSIRHRRVPPALHRRRSSRVQRSPRAAASISR